ncbi:Loganate O-methyltransferase [Handroanthus impetiginosus]|uniref:Loganate O-methyltransferase n=1 Tax=Handroanthus impetiginosus TaxID=429701 RepID=A0A2G9H7R2_9LAMI|nr:Loganate O-methyltransferase [Handroanthus impetiginosus]
MEEKKFNGTSSEHHMLGGDGPNSYAHNSHYQKKVELKYLKFLPCAETGDNLSRGLNPPTGRQTLNTQNPSFTPDNTFIIADFGCSIGPNTFLAVENIISSIENKYKKWNQNQTLDFQEILSRLSSPGSFYSRLLPKKTIHFAHSSTSLHWLSRIPKEVIESGNKGKIHCLGGEKDVKEAYAAQYEDDFGRFLRARGDELVDGGLMALLVFGFAERDVYSLFGVGMVFEMLGSCLEDVAKLGKFTKEKVYSFNLPFYFPSESELKALIEANGSFCIETIAKMAAPMSH